LLINSLFSVYYFLYMQTQVTSWKTARNVESINSAHTVTARLARATPESAQQAYQQSSRTQIRAITRELHRNLKQANIWEKLVETRPFFCINIDPAFPQTVWQMLLTRRNPNHIARVYGILPQSTDVL